MAGASATSSSQAVRLLDVDRDLARDLPPGEERVARRYVTAPASSIEPGVWQPDADGARPPLGLLMLDGLVAREVTLAGMGCTELIGKGDLLRPWDQDEGYPSVPSEVSWAALERTRVALLDDRFVAASARWPSLLTILLGRAVRRSQSLAIHLAITCITGLEVRLHVLLWHLADRWGHVAPDGVVLPLRLTHEMLGRLVRARRPSVGIALKELSGGGAITRRDDGGFVLHGSPPQELSTIQQEAEAPTSRIADS